MSKYNIFNNFFKSQNNKSTKEIIHQLTNELKSDAKRLRSNLSRIDNLAISIKKEQDKIEESKKNLINLIDCVDTLIWAKDENHNYSFANETHCITFLGLSAKCKNKIKNRGDIELINDFMERTGLVHSYGYSCFDSDEYTKNAGVNSKFIEIGWVGNKLLILYVSKTPYFDSEGKYIGSIGIAYDYSKKAHYIHSMLDTGIKDKSVELIFKDEFKLNGKKVFTYTYTLNETNIDYEFFRESGFPT